MTELIGATLRMCLIDYIGRESVEAFEQNRVQFETVVVDNFKFLENMELSRLSLIKYVLTFNSEYLERMTNQVDIIT
jgi:hypothetical protein